MPAWEPDDFDKFKLVYLGGHTDFSLSTIFANATPDRVGKFIAKKVAEGELPRRTTFKSANGAGVVPLNQRVGYPISEIPQVDVATLPKPFEGDPNNVLVIGDTHFPFCKEGYLEFCRATQEKFNCGTVIHIGDETDQCAMSYHELDPDGHSAAKEADLAQAELNKWYYVFPKVKVLIGNHTELHFRKAFTSGVPKRFLKSYEQVWNAPEGWTWHLELELDGVYYIHGTGQAGDKAAITRAVNRQQSVVMGHIHTASGVTFNNGGTSNVFGMQVGCGINENAYAMAYAKLNTRRAILSCGVILDNGKTPFVVMMD